MNNISCKYIVLCSIIFSAHCFAGKNVAPINQLMQQSSPIVKITTNNNNLENQEQLWSLMLYRGTTSDQSFLGVISFHYSGIGETMYAAELAYTLSKYNVINKYLYPYTTLQIAANIGERFSTQEKNHPAFEGDLYLVLRWKYFPWNQYLTTTAAIGDGGSYTSHILIGEKNDWGLNPNTTPVELQRLLNFFMLEVTFALPKHPELQLLTRLHHRCTLFGLTSDSKQGSTNIGIGIRYYF